MPLQGGDDSVPALQATAVVATLCFVSLPPLLTDRFSSHSWRSARRNQLLLHHFAWQVQWQPDFCHQRKLANLLLQALISLKLRQPYPHLARTTHQQHCHVLWLTRSLMHICLRRAPAAEPCAVVFVVTRYTASVASRSLFPILQATLTGYALCLLYWYHGAMNEV